MILKFVTSFISIMILTSLANADGVGICSSFFNTKSKPPLVTQQKDYTCGPASLQSWLHSQGINKYSEQELSVYLKTRNHNGTLSRDFLHGLRQMGFQSNQYTNMNYAQLKSLHKKGLGLFLLVRLDMVDHWVLLVSMDKNQVELMDPWRANTDYIRLPKRAFLNKWHSSTSYRYAIAARPH